MREERAQEKDVVVRSPAPPGLLPGCARVLATYALLLLPGRLEVDLQAVRRGLGARDGSAHGEHLPVPGACAEELVAVVQLLSSLALTVDAEVGRVDLPVREPDGVELLDAAGDGEGPLHVAGVACNLRSV